MSSRNIIGHMPCRMLSLRHTWSIPRTNDNDPMSQVFDQFCTADTFQSIMDLFQQLCDATDLYPRDHVIFYQQLRTRLVSWRAQSLWTKLDKRASNAEYKKGMACNNMRVLVIGAGPCGLRVAIEMALLGAKTVVVEKRDSFSRNNVLHLWPFLIHDLKALGAKKFFGKFCAGSIDHISIRTLQCILLKVALLVGVEIHPGVSFEGFVEPKQDESVESSGWQPRVLPVDHPLSEFVFNVCISADGKRNTMTEFKRKELRGKFAIGITANFINRKTQAEASVEEISGVSFIFNQKFFKDLYDDTGIDLENIVYYKDETHYFVMTAKKLSLLQKGVLLQDYDDPSVLLSKSNVNHEALLAYAREAADYSTKHRLPNLEFAPNHTGRPDVDMFDFTSMFAAEHACRVVEKRGHKLLVGLVGDTLLEPFWPTGSGCARGFLGALDAAWMVRSWASEDMSPLEVIAERESIYQLLSQTKADNLNKNYANYTVDPTTRYMNLQMLTLKPQQAESLYDGSSKYSNSVIRIHQRQNQLYDMLVKKRNLLTWFQKQLASYESIVRVTDLSKSWHSGLALNAFIHKHRPHLIDVYALDPNEVEYNNQLAFEILQKHFSISAPTTGNEMAKSKTVDEQMVISYLTRIRDCFKRENLATGKVKRVHREKKLSLSEESLHTAVIGKNDMKENGSGTLKRNQYDTSPRDVIRPSKRSRDFDSDENSINSLKSSEMEDVLSRQQTDRHKDAPGTKWKLNRVSVLAKDLVSKFKGEYVEDEDKKKASKPASPGRQQLRDVCSFCAERVFVTERCIAEGRLFHRKCFRCEYCCGLLEITSYSVQMSDDGKDVFCHMKCHDLEMRRKENPIKHFNSQSSWVRAPVDRATFESTRKILLRQSQMSRDESKKKNFSSHFPSRQNDGDFKSSTEEELCFSDESDSEKPDLSWDEGMMRPEKRIDKIFLVPSNSSISVATSHDGGSDADWETDSSGTEEDILSADSEENDSKSCEGDLRIDTEKNKPEKSDDSSGNKLQKDAANQQQKDTNNQQKDSVNQPQQNSVGGSRLQNRMAFFHTVSEPVRIDARQFLGLTPQVNSDEVVVAPQTEAKNDEEEPVVVPASESPGVSKNDDDENKEITKTEENPEQKPDAEEIPDKKPDSRAGKAKQRPKRKKQVEAKKKKLQKTKKQMSERKMEKKVCKTVVASTSVIASHQTVAVVPLSEEESSDEETAKNASTRENADAARNNSLLGQGETSQLACPECDDSKDAQPLAADESVVDGKSINRRSGEFETEVSKAPRPELLSAEAMFRSCEDTVIVSASPGSDNLFCASSSDEEKLARLSLAGHDSSPSNTGNVKTEALGSSSHLYDRDIVEVKKLPLQKSMSDDFIYKRFASRTSGESDENSCLLNEDTSGSTSSSFVECAELKDLAASIVEASSSHQNLQLSEVDVRRAEETDLYLSGLRPIGDRRKMNLLPDDSLYSLESITSYDSRELAAVADDFQGLREGKSNAPAGVKSGAPRADIESFSEDDRDLSRDVSQDFMAIQSNVKMSDALLEQSEFSAKQSESAAKQLESATKQSESAVKQLESPGLQEAKKDSYSAGNSVKVRTNATEDSKIVDKTVPFTSLDPVSRLNCLLRSLSKQSVEPVDVSSHLNDVTDIESVKCDSASTVQLTENGLNIEEGNKSNREKLDENVNYVSSTTFQLKTEQTLATNSFCSGDCSGAQRNSRGGERMHSDREKQMSSDDENKSSEISGKASTSDTNEKVGRSTKGETQISGRDEKADAERSCESVSVHRSVAGKVGDRGVVASSPVSLMDAKRRFFHEVAQPVRINPQTVFKDVGSAKDVGFSRNKLLGRMHEGNGSSSSVGSTGTPDSVTSTDVWSDAKDSTEVNVEVKEPQKVKRRVLPTVPTDNSQSESSSVQSARNSSPAGSEKICQTSQAENTLSTSENKFLSTMQPKDEATSATRRRSSLPIDKIIFARVDESQGRIEDLGPKDCGGQSIHRASLNNLDRVSLSRVTAFANLERGSDRPVDSLPEPETQQC